MIGRSSGDRISIARSGEKHGSLLQVLVSTQRRGAEVFACDLGAALAGRGIDTRSVALTAAAGSAVLEVPVLGLRPFGPSTLRALRSEARRVRVVVAHGSRTLPASALATAGTGSPFVYRSIGDPRYWAGSRARRMRSTALLRRARGVVTLWPGAAEALVDRHRVPESRVRVIPNGVPAARFPPVDAERRALARATLGLDGERQVVVYLGSLSPEKNVGDAVAVVARLPDTDLVVVGDGPERARLVRLADEVAPRRVTFVGGTADPASALAAADVLVLPSTTEGMPAVLIEAGLSALPVVATDVGGVGEVVVDGETGRLVPPADPPAFAGALAEVLLSASDMGRAARARCLARFEIGVVAEAWERFLCDLLAADDVGSAG